MDVDHGSSLREGHGNPANALVVTEADFRVYAFETLVAPVTLDDLLDQLLPVLDRQDLQITCGNKPKSTDHAREATYRERAPTVAEEVDLVTAHSYSKQTLMYASMMLRVSPNPKAPANLRND